MKKLMTIVLAAAVMFAAAGPAQAALETSGEFRARFWNLGNYLAQDEEQEFWDQRLRLNMDWQIAEGVKLHTRADILEAQWGDTLASASQTAPSPGVTYSTTSNAKPQVAFDHVNLSFTVPNTPLNVIVGRQDASWGPGNFTKADNRDRFKVTAKFGETTALYTYDKYTEVGGQHGQFGLGDRRQHSVGAITALAGWNMGIIYGGIFDESVDVNNNLTDSVLHAFDAYAMGKIGPANLTVEATYGFGENDVNGQDLSGLLLYAGVTAPVGPVTIGLEGSYAAGDDKGTSDENEGALKAEYQSPMWSVILFNNFDLDGFKGESKSGATDTGVTNAVVGKVSASVPVGPISFYGAAVYAQRLEETAVNAGDDEALGTEIDLVANYAINPAVTLTVGGGYLIAGDYFGDIDDPWGVVAAFTTKF